MTRLASFKLDITDYYWDGDINSENPEDDSHGLIPAAFGHSTLQRFFLKAAYVSFPEFNIGLPSSLPVSTSLKYVEIPTIAISSIHLTGYQLFVIFVLECPYLIDLLIRTLIFAASFLT